MNLHNDRELFENLVAKTAKDFALDEALVIKDYFVVLALKMLYSSNSNLVFIGGTSLSKCFNLIQRFSEDIDIVAVGNSRKNRQKITTDVIEFLKDNWFGTIEENNHKFNDFKEAYLNYDTSRNSTLDQRVKVELITFTDPFPTLKSFIKPIVSNSMTSHELIQYDMDRVQVITQEPFRTMLEKILLEKEIYKDFLAGKESEESQEKRARDFYDIHKIFNYYENKLPFDKTLLMEIIESRKNNRKKRTFIDENEFNNLSLMEMFHNRKIAHQLTEVDRQKLSIRDLDTTEIEESLSSLDVLFKNMLL